MFEKYKINKLIGEVVSSPDKDHKEALKSLRGYGQSGLDALFDQLRISKLLPHDMMTLLNVFYDKTQIDNFIELLGDSMDVVRDVARRIIQSKGGVAVLPRLIEQIKEGNHYKRRELAELITEFATPTTLVKITPLLHEDDREVKKTAISLIGAIGGESAARHIMVLVGSDDHWIRKKAVETLATLKDPACKDALLNQLDVERDPKIKTEIIKTVGEVGDAESARRILPHIDNDDMVLRQAVVEAIENTADSSIVHDVLEIMKDAEVNVRRAAVNILDKVKDPNAIHMLLKALQDSDWWVREIATDALVELKTGGLNKKVIELFQSKEENVRRSAVEYFLRSPDADAFDGLVGLLKDSDWWVREKSIQALGKIGDEKAIEPLLELEGDSEVRLTVPEAFGEIGGDKAVMYLHEFLEDTDRSFRIASLKAIGKIKSKVSLPHLKNMVKDTDVEVRDTALAIIKEITGRAVRVDQLLAEQEKEKSSGASTVISAAMPEGTTVLSEAILVLDLVGSTEMGSTHGDEFAMKLTQKLVELTKPLAARHHVKFTKSTGDGYLMTFVTVENAAMFSQDILEKLNSHNEKQPDDEKIMVRLAINMGETRVDSKGDRLGTAVNMTFRIEGVKPENLITDEGGMTKEEMPIVNRIIVTEPVHKDVTRGKKFETRYVGFFDLKGITGRHRLYQLLER